MASKKGWRHFNSLKQDPERYRLYLEKDKEQKKKERKTKVSSPSELAKKRRECRKRVRLHRLKTKKSHSVKLPQARLTGQKGMTFTVPIYRAFSLGLSVFDTIDHLKLRKKQLRRGVQISDKKA